MPPPSYDDDQGSQLQPLKGITVVTLEHAIAAPFTTRQLADLGARVIKIERPGTGDFARRHDKRARGLSSHFVWANRSKESLALVVNNSDAGAILQRLIMVKADVVVQNLAPRLLRCYHRAIGMLTAAMVHVWMRYLRCVSTPMRSSRSWALMLLRLPPCT